MDLTLWLELVLFVFLMGLSGFFSSSETSLFSLSNLQLEQMRRDGHPRIGTIERMLEQPRRLIITILIGNELVNVAASVISAAVIIQFFGAENKFLNLFIMVPILLLVGEITPKTLAIRNNVAFAAAESRPIEFFARLLTPLRWIVRNVSEIFITLIVGKERSRGNIITEDMVRALAHEAVGEGTLDSTEADFIDQIFDFGEKSVADVMTPRSNIDFLPEEAPLSEVLSVLERTHHSKLPVYREHRDTIVGVLHARDLLAARSQAHGKQETAWPDLLREAYFVPETKPAVDLFDAFRERKLSIALTVDEYGGVTGLITMEDLLECIFGDIHSPSDEVNQGTIKRLEDGSFEVEGTTSIEIFNQTTGLKLAADEAESIAGLLLNKHGELPTPNTVIELDNVRFFILSVDNNRIEKIRCEVIAGQLLDEFDLPQESARETTSPLEADESKPPRVDESGDMIESGRG